MNILSIGNSFSQDAQRWLHAMAKSAGVSLHAENLYIGGCSLARHVENMETGEAAYELFVNGEFAQNISLQDAIKRHEWDVVTLQQVSGDSGDYSTFQPDLDTLCDFVRTSAPSAQIMLHKTWAYDIGSGHPDFVKYDSSQKIMHEKISEAYALAAKHTGLSVIPTGDAVQYLREHCDIFDIENGGMSLCRDSFHLSFLYGRFAAGLVWLHTLTGTDPMKVSFVPSHEGETADEAILDTIKKSVHDFLMA